MDNFNSPKDLIFAAKKMGVVFQVENDGQGLTLKNTEKLPDYLITLIELNWVELAAYLWCEQHNDGDYVWLDTDRLIYPTAQTIAA